MMSRLCFRSALLVLLAFAALPAQAEKFYKWTDQNGVVQYTAEPPKDVPFEETYVSGVGGEAGIGAASPTAAAADPFAQQDDATTATAGRPLAAAKGPVASIEEQQRMGCQVSSGQLETAARLYASTSSVRVPKGTTSAEQYAREIETLRKDVQKFCGASR